MADLDDLDAAVRRVDPDRWLATRFITDAQARADVIAIYAFDHEVARAPKVASNPIIGEIRLTWWADAIAEIYEGRPVRRHPVTLALQSAVRRRALPRAGFEALIDARYPELDKAAPDQAAIAAAAMQLAAAVLGAPDAQLRRVGEAAARPTPEAIAAANAELLRLPAAAFPAVAHVALAEKPGASPLAKRIRLARAVLRGRI